MLSVVWRKSARKVFREADEAGELPADVVEAGWEMGVLPTSIPEEYGGFGDYSGDNGGVGD
ncbi:MAG: acyl-CoA dehydrogenase family protein [Chloroflexi bacterium]|nr:acyl-CoA dehydrogenase family protein [Chloroflexota bacterium]